MPLIGGPGRQAIIISELHNADLTLYHELFRYKSCRCLRAAERFKVFLRVAIDSLIVQELGTISMLSVFCGKCGFLHSQ